MTHAKAVESRSLAIAVHRRSAFSCRLESRSIFAKAVEQRALGDRHHRCLRNYAGLAGLVTGMSWLLRFAIVHQWRCRTLAMASPTGSDGFLDSICDSFTAAGIPHQSITATLVCHGAVWCHCSETVCCRHGQRAADLSNRGLLHSGCGSGACGTWVSAFQTIVE